MYMYSLLIRQLVFLCISVASCFTFAADNIKTEGGTLLTQSEIDNWKLTIYPDGINLPEGSGNAIQGEKIYNMKCLACHGAAGQNGTGPRLVGKQGFIDEKKDVLEAMSVGAWPYATSIYDYIRRAMPHYAPKSLSNNDVYALTAYILYLNGITNKTMNLDKESLSKVEMPNKKIVINAWLKEQKDNGK
ncbi:c-type cytochrome [Colwellia psychrerythraea]|uniref:Cytochrome c domain-containing protein n=1 Tax=Colwellia psychrerythraea TaxID=28229 RepID=A0A099KRQ7_COLPS|nr:cytochrome c [Colwellia psychrerythraea]KGJ92905.1 hypothetical protein ND2E_2371 [Colwellia psychrerythraea]